MYLRDFNKTPGKRMAKLNSLLKEQFNMKLGGFPPRKKLAKLREVAEENLVKIRGSNKKFQLDPEYAKFLGIKDIAEIMIAESMYAESPKYMEMKNMITASVQELMDSGYTMQEACNECMNRYRKDPRWVYDDEHVLPIVMMAAKNYMESCNMANEQIEDAVMPEPTLESRIRKALDEGDAATARQLMKKMSEGAAKPPRGSVGLAKAGQKATKNIKKKGVKKESMFSNLIAELLNEEVDVESAEVVMAVRSLADEVQDMVERFGRMVNEDLAAITDQMRAEMGASTAQGFYDSMSQAINQHLDATRQLKTTIDQQVNSLAGGGEDMGLGGDDMGMGGDDMGMDADPMAGDMGGDMDLDALAGGTADNVPAAAGPEDEPLGRAEV